MCGRFTLASEPNEIADYLEAELGAGVADQLRASWNIAPTTPVLGASVQHERRSLDLYRWGLIPSWVKQLSAFRTATFNARVEALASRPTFRSAFLKRRLLVPADSFFEWRKAGNRQPYVFKRADGEPMAFAGLWEAWKHPEEGHWLRSCTIITVEANADMAAIHNRMPLVLERDAWERWLDPDLQDREELEAMLHPLQEGVLLHYPVDRRVGSVTNDDPGLIAPVPADSSGQLSLLNPDADEQDS